MSALLPPYLRTILGGREWVLSSSDSRSSRSPTTEGGLSGEWNWERRGECERTQYAVRSLEFVKSCMASGEVVYSVMSSRI